MRTQRVTVRTTSMRAQIVGDIKEFVEKSLPFLSVRNIQRANPSRRSLHNLVIGQEKVDDFRSKKDKLKKEKKKAPWK